MNLVSIWSKNSMTLIYTLISMPAKFTRTFSIILGKFSSSWTVIHPKTKKWNWTFSSETKLKIISSNIFFNLGVALHPDFKISKRQQTHKYFYKLLVISGPTSKDLPLDFNLLAVRQQAFLFLVLNIYKKWIQVDMN